LQRSGHEYERFTSLVHYWLIVRLSPGVCPRSAGPRLSCCRYRARAITLDVTDVEQFKRVVNEAEHAFGRIGVLVNNAGYGYLAAVEGLSQPLAREVEPLGIRVLLVDTARDRRLAAGGSRCRLRQQRRRATNPLDAGARRSAP